ncbi:hypothetical protein SEA_DAKITI_80 [Gordonia phage Dakiti]|nr:hypothetical protein SEA_DAKITI_80 [Gordonia phage Dakiti]
MANKKKRMSHKYCAHPATSHERAKCRAKHADQGERVETSVPELGMNTTGDGMSVGQLANLLASSLESLRYAEARVEEHQRAAELAQEALTREMLHREPKPTAEGASPVVAFKKRYTRDASAKSYEYVSIGIPEEYVRRSTEHPDCDILGVRLMWYVTVGKRAIAPMPWSELVKFMGLEGLKTLEVLRAG